MRADDLPVFFANQADEVANNMAAFAAERPDDRHAFDDLWRAILANDRIVVRTILEGERVAGNVIHFEQLGKPAVGYWLGREFWGRGIASRALALFLRIVTRRPLFARVATDNLGSLRVLERCGFTIVGADVGYSFARARNVEEHVLRLDPPESAAP